MAKVLYKYQRALFIRPLNQRHRSRAVLLDQFDFVKVILDVTAQFFARRRLESLVKLVLLLRFVIDLGFLEVTVKLLTGQACILWQTFA